MSNILHNHQPVYLPPESLPPTPLPNRLVPFLAAFGPTVAVALARRVTAKSAIGELVQTQTWSRYSGQHTTVVRFSSIHQSPNVALGLHKRRESLRALFLPSGRTARPRVNTWQYSQGSRHQRREKPKHVRGWSTVIAFFAKHTVTKTPKQDKNLGRREHHLS